MTKDIKRRKPKVTTKLTSNQKQIIKWITIDRLTIKQIAIKKGLVDDKGKPKTKSIYNIISKLKLKGVLTNSQTSTQELLKQIPKDKYLRLHAIAITIKILSSSQLYINRLNNKNYDIRDYNHIDLQKNNLKIYINKDFYGNEVQECFNEMQVYLNNFLVKLENDYNITLIKPRNTKILLFRQHIADIRDPLSKYVIDNKKHFNVYDDEGVLRLVIDNSFIPEKETVHQKHAPDDMQRLVEFNKDLILNPQSLNLSELTKLSQENTINLNQVSKQLIEMNNALLVVVEQQKQIIKQYELKTKLITPSIDKHAYGSYFN